MENQKDHIFKTKTEKVGDKTFVLVEVHPNNVKRLIPVFLSSPQLDIIFEKIAEHHILIPTKSNESKQLIKYWHKIVRNTVLLPITAEQRDGLLSDLQELVPPVQLKMSKQMVTWAFNMKDKIANEGENALSAVLNDPNSLSDEPLWRIKRRE